MGFEQIVGSVSAIELLTQRSQILEAGHLVNLTLCCGDSSPHECRKGDRLPVGLTVFFDCPVLRGLCEEGLMNTPEQNVLVDAVSDTHNLGLTLQINEDQDFYLCMAQR